MAAVIGQKDRRLPLVQPEGQRHRLSRGSRLVEQRGVGDLHAGEITDHRLEGQDRFHSALGDLGLIGRVGGVPGRVLEHVSLDHRRRVGAVVALADEALEQLVAAGDRLQLSQRCRLGERLGELHRLLAGDPGRHDFGDQARE